LKTVQGRLFIIDDSADNIAILGSLLSRYQRNFARSGREALALLSSCSPPDLILLDLVMPEMDGFEVLARLQKDERLRDVPVIFITAVTDAETEARGFQLGAVDYIAKPFNVAVVQARVRTHLALKAAKEALYRQNLNLEEQVVTRTQSLAEALKQVKNASLETIVRLARAAEYRDECTGEHVIRMSYYSAAVARQMALPAQDIENILHAAPMHDIGKIGIPDSILLKPGKLDQQEICVMQRHTQIGAQILSGSASDVIKIAEEIALTHHEKWDGTGYPLKLKENGIPLFGRIVAIADVFDALCSPRVYKPAMPVVEVRVLIDRERGRHFDPDVTDAFMAAWDEVIEIKARFPPAERC
jgi:putative two-component system response regulator